MKRCLTFISLLLLCLSVIRAQDNVAEYSFLMQARGQDVTGICLIDGSPQNGDSVRGTVVNEFGVKAFDFTYRRGKAKVENVIGPLNKWYIRRVLNGDFTFILKHIGEGHDAVQKKRSMKFLPGGDISVSNERYHINYLLTPLRNNP